MGPGAYNPLRFLREFDVTIPIEAHQETSPLGSSPPRHSDNRRIGEVFDDWHWNRLLDGPKVALEAQTHQRFLDQKRWPLN
jgi:hypothetical protein